MPACPGGAIPTPGAEDLQVWIDRAQLPLDVISLLTSYTPLAWAAIAASLVDISAICAENPDPPEPITAADVIEQTAALVPFVPFAQDKVIAKAYQWLRYQQFLAHCQCVPPQLTPELNCWSLPSGASTNVNNSIVAQTVVTIDQVVFDSWTVQLNGSMSGFGTYHMAAVSSGWNSADQFLEFQRPDGTWIAFVGMDIPQPGELPITNASWPAGQHPASLQIPMRIRHAAGPAGTFTDFRYCWEVSGTDVAPPLPVQPPLTDVPLPPAHACGDSDLCAMITQLSHRLTTVAAQLSDVQAVITGRDVLTLLSQQPMSGEGEATLALGTRAVSVELTVLGEEAYTSALGRPRGLMRVGSIRYGDGTGYSPRRFIDADRFTDQVPAGALNVSWQLLPGTSGFLKFLG